MTEVPRTCAEVQRALVERFDDAQADALPAAIAEHIASCDACAAVAGMQQRLDARLTSALAPPTLSSSFRAGLHRQLDVLSGSSTRPVDVQTRLPALSDALPDVLHLAGCGVLTAFCAIARPADTTVIVGIGTFLTVATYVVLTLMRNTLDESRL